MVEVAALSECYTKNKSNIKQRLSVYEKRHKKSEECNNKSTSRSPRSIEGYNKSTDTSFTTSEDESMKDPSTYQRVEQKVVPECSTSADRDWSRDILFLLLVSACIAFCFFIDTYMHKIKTKDDEFREKLSHLSKKYPNQDEKLWNSFNSGITGIQIDNPRKPSVFLLLHRENYHTSECLVQEIAESATKFLSNSLEPMFIRGEDIKDNTDFINNYGLFIEKYRGDIERRKVMVIFNLQDFPPVIARAFHSFCDRINPTVKEAAYVFTLQVRGEDKNPTKAAERELTYLWNNTLSQNILDPLIIRITDRVLFVQPESNDVCL